MQCSNHKKCNNKNYYLLLILSSSYKCDRDCPFCTAKITQLEEGKNNWIELENQLDIIQKNSIVFDHVTIGGNGEPSLNSYDDLIYLK